MTAVDQDTHAIAEKILPTYRDKFIGGGMHNGGFFTGNMTEFGSTTQLINLKDTVSYPII